MERGHPVRVGFDWGRAAAGAVIAVKAVSPLVDRHPRNLTEVPAPAGSLIEIERISAPGGVAPRTLIDVDVDVAVTEPAEIRQIALRPQIGRRQVVVLGPSGRGVARATGVPGETSSPTST